ncbi:MAG: 4-hydroxy-2-oxoheptanedioate aldolase [Pseudomonadales bacterium]|nr:4-hydroxy-2-oxoheptanedioate aldolase [Pseudomonadales bacterium]NRA14156.1 4-hydroxy-2-oxoheptanedioate aldolase [Oceanospirillaceae bacterium]
MSTPINTFKQALQDGRTQWGFWLGLASPYTAEISAGAGFDWLLIDGEHAPNDIQSVLGQLQAIAPYPTAAVVRPAEGTTAIIKQLLDIGAQSLLIPMVESAAQATALVQTCHYPPQGIRGVGTVLARAAQWGRHQDYLTKANAEVCLLLQVESRAGLDALSEIVNTAGVDGVFIGPADLAASLGYLGQPAHPEVKAIIEQALKTIRAAGKAAGILATDKALAEHYRGCGAQFIAIGVDTLVLANGASALAASVKGDLAAPEPGNGGY